MVATINTPSGPVIAPANCVPVCPPSKDMLQPGKYVVNDLDKMEAITQPLYSYQAYPAAGTASLVFFQTAASGTVTREDTNMELQGQLPAPQKFLVQGIGVDYLPGIAPVSLGAAAVLSQANDMFAILRRGYLEFIIGTKPYLQVSPLKILPPRSRIAMDGLASNASTAAAAQSILGTIGKVEGDVYRPAPLLLEASQNFRVQITFPGGNVAIPSADAGARIGVILYGTLYRSPQ